MATDPLPRQDAPLVHADAAEHRRQIAQRANAGLAMDGSNRATAPLPLFISTVADLPNATLWEGSWIYVSDETGGAVPAFSDGTDWRRCTDRAVVS